jgi:hypothetical protein
MRRAASWYSGVLAGVALIIIGLIVDAWRHSASAASEESLLSLDNPGHVVAAVGLGIAAVSALVGLTLGWSEQAGWPAPEAPDVLRRLGVPAVCWIAVGGFTVGAAAYITEKEGEQAMTSTTKKAAKKAAARPGPRTDKADGESAVLAKIAALPGPDRAMGERLHAIIKANAPALSPRLWYGMPAYAKDGKVVCFFRPRDRFDERYMTLGFNDGANLDEGAMWPIAFALTELTAADEARIGGLVKKAVS